MTSGETRWEEADHVGTKGQKHDVKQDVKLFQRIGQTSVQCCWSTLRKPPSPRAASDSFFPPNTNRKLLPAKKKKLKIDLLYDMK